MVDVHQVNKSAEALDHRVQEPADNNPLKSTTAVEEEKGYDEADSNPLKSTTAVEEEKDFDEANINPLKSTSPVEEEKDSDEDFTTPPPSTQSRSNVKDVLCAKPLSFVGGKPAHVVPPNVCLKPGRRSKRLRIISSKLDGRFHFDKKIKGLVGHPYPLVVESNECVDPEERFQGSLKKTQGNKINLLTG